MVLKLRLNITTIASRSFPERKRSPGAFEREKRWNTRCCALKSKHRGGFILGYRKRVIYCSGFQTALAVFSLFSRHRLKDQGLPQRIKGCQRCCYHWLKERFAKVVNFFSTTAFKVKETCFMESNSKCLTGCFNRIEFLRATQSVCKLLLSIKRDFYS